MSPEIIRTTSWNLSALLLIVLFLFTPGYTEQQQDSSYPELKSVQKVSEDYLPSRIDTINCWCRYTGSLLQGVKRCKRNLS